MLNYEHMIQFLYSKGAFTAVKGHYADAGVDLRTPDAVLVPAGGSATIDTKTVVKMPCGIFGKIESKSGLNVNHDIVSCGSVIDSGYEGHIRVKLYNLGKEDYQFMAGDKIAQIIFIPCKMGICGIEIQSDDERGDNGFGSTGK